MRRHSELILFEQFKQFIFSRQWKALKDYAGEKGIKLFGDIPFYIGYDSADVWANQNYFHLDSQKRMVTVAGVPPDYFNSKGQLWNMPVFNWDVMKRDSYSWWIKRLKRNVELFDLVRFDHFRAFSAFWEIPGDEPNAIKGKWSKGPGSDFLRHVKESIPKMPFIAEDLGDIDQAVYDLKDEFSLPGMQVLQFSFEYDMHRSIHTPHNHKFNSVVYTGTHDNNTLKGWFDKDLSDERKNWLKEYSRRTINSENAHRELIQMAFASDAKLAIIPAQDFLGLGADTRMNVPSTRRGNWVWKLKSLSPLFEIKDWIKKIAEVHGRGQG
jgi:4-alpha-glucanotransferase